MSLHVSSFGASNFGLGKMMLKSKTSESKNNIVHQCMMKGLCAMSTCHAISYMQKIVLDSWQLLF